MQLRPKPRPSVSPFSKEAWERSFYIPFGKQPFQQAFCGVQLFWCLLCSRLSKWTWEVHCSPLLTLDIDINRRGHVDVPVDALVGSGIICDHFWNCECLAEDDVAALSHQHPVLGTTLVVGPKPIQVPLSPEKSIPGRYSCDTPWHEAMTKRMEGLVLTCI